MGHLGGDVAALPTHGDVKIKFISVYDTVGALCVPIAAAARVSEPIVGFHNTTLGDTVEHPVQALAVDEKRGPYVPALWTQAADAVTFAERSVLQVWFPGVHSDIGDGYHNKGIGNVTWDAWSAASASGAPRSSTRRRTAARRATTYPPT